MTRSTADLAAWLVPITKWLLIARLALVVAVASVSVLVIWPRSRHWKMANRLHRIATRNEASIRVDTRRHLEVALRALEGANRECLLSGRGDDTALIGRLLRHVDLARDRVASDYIPSSANLPGHFRELDLKGLEASEAVEDHCLRLAGQLREGMPLVAIQVDEAEDAVRRIENWRLALS